MDFSEEQFKLSKAKGQNVRKGQTCSRSIYVLHSYDQVHYIDLDIFKDFIRSKKI